MATDAREALKLDRLIFVPAGAQPFKVDTPPVASAQDRLEMVRLAVADDANYVVDDAEINRKGLSFMVDTLEHLSERNPAAQLFLLLGEDVLAGFEQWRNPARIRELATLAAVRRTAASGSMCPRRRSGSAGVLENQSRDSCPRASNGSSTSAGSVVEAERLRLRKTGTWR